MNVEKQKFKGLNEATVPEELKNRNQWVVWHSQKRANGKVGKIPVNPRTGSNASVSDKTTWGSFEEALEAFMTLKNTDGLGFVFTADDPFIGIDIDDCRDTSGEINSDVQDIINRLDSYTEISPSGGGVHIIAKGEIPGKGKRKGLVEIYDQGRFFTVTGEHLTGTPSNVNESIHIQHIYNELLDNAKKDSTSLSNPEELIRQASEASNGEKFKALFNGDWSAYSSQSEADLAFCGMLAFWTDNNPLEIDNLFRKSKLYRSKWERQDYSDGCISKAISSTINTAEKLTTNGFNLTDLGNSKRLMGLYKNSIRYCSTWKQWLVWNGKYWEIDHKAEIKKMARAVIKSIYREASDGGDDVERKRIANHAMKTESLSRINAMVALAKDNSGVRVRAEELDTDLWLLNCENGIIDLKTGELFSHDPGILITNFVPVTYDPAATCPTWETFLHRIMGGNEEMIQFLQRAVGYSLTGDTSEQCFFILYGSGANGKSTFLAPLIRVLNDYAKQSPPETFLNLKKRGVNNDIARLKGVRFVTATEPEANQSFAEGVLKQLTGGDVVSARFLNKEFFDFIPVFKLFLATNHKPIVSGKDHGIWRRIRLVPFEVTIPKEEQDPQLGQKLIEELPGVLAWAVRGCLDWQANGLGQPQVVIDATNEYAKEMDTVARFIEDCCVTGRAQTISSNDLYSSFSNWCGQEGEESISKIVFSKQLRGKGFSPYRTSTERGWKGIGAKVSFTMPQYPSMRTTSDVQIAAQWNS